MSTHLGDEQIRRLLGGTLPDDELVQVEAHLWECPDCRDALRRRTEPTPDLPLLAERSDGAAPEGDLPEVSSFELRGTTNNGDFPASLGRYLITGKLGSGGFGVVYKGYDDELRREVAIKVPNPERINRPEDLALFLNEARILATLDHPHIVPVHDVGRIDGGTCFVVSKLIEGSDLACRIKKGRPSFQESAELTATVGEALHHAHTRWLVHRDIKPANILIDRSGKPCVADFGIALKDEDFGKGRGLAGTPAYMSPEQARGEGHRVDGRSDIFSLGVVLYELLAGRRPFRGESLSEIIDQVAEAEARPPRQIDDTIPKELERICLKAMSKRPSERYTTASDMAQDLRLFLATSGGGAVTSATPGLLTPPPGSTVQVTPVPITPPHSDSDQRLVKIVPKGLRSFDEHDADFFLELLPGPRDRDGLPESIRFWKRKIEQLDPNKTFAVGLMYGPSGCGKSSMIKAGLLPRLDKHVLHVYVEATAEETEARLLKGLRGACVELSHNLDLVESLAELRRRRFLPADHKVLLVIDQFEQWLFAKRAEENTELIAALRHCDGRRLQAIVTVRDDFWLAASRFARDLDVRFLEGENAALVDLFDLRHGKKVLLALGRAYGALPEAGKELNKDQETFLNQTITGLAQDGKIISVRLALFADMMKGKPWTPATLSRVGGTEGVGFAFLEETFSASSAPPEHRLHQKAAQAVLKSLLPDSGTDIKGQMRSRQELLEVSGYEGRPRDFDDLIRILDPELRLITPTDPEGVTGGELRVAGENEGVAGEGGSILATHHPPLATRYYQLTHDYLVPSLRDWLTRKQRETRRGRAELRLTERSALWNAKRENRLLPSALEWANFRLLSQKKNWTEEERRMMRRAGRFHGLRAAGLAALIAATAWAGTEAYGRVRADALVESLRSASTADVPPIVKQLASYRHWTDASLRRVLYDSDAESRDRLHASLALLPVDPSQSKYLFDRLAKAAPTELPVLRDALTAHKNTLAPKLWTILESAKPDDDRLLPCAGALASYDPRSTNWESMAAKVAQALVSINPVFLGSWLDALRPVRSQLTASLAAIFQDNARPESVHSLATNILADYASDDPARLGQLLLVADHTAYRRLFPVAEKKAGHVVPVLQAELNRKASYSWNDRELDGSWTKPEAALVTRIESAHGMLLDRFAFCQTLPLDEFVTTADALRKSGYRPTRFRPYADRKSVLVAAVWTRDGRDWRISSGLTAEEVRHEDNVRRGSPDPAGSNVRRGSPDPAGEADRRSPPPENVRRGSPDPAGMADRRSPSPEPAPETGRPAVTRRAGSGDPRPTFPGDPRPTLSGDPRPTLSGDPRLALDERGGRDKFIPIDVAGYLTTDASGNPVERYAAVWLMGSGNEDARMYVGLTIDDETELHNKWKEEMLVPRTVHAVIGSDGRPKCSGVWERSSATDGSWRTYRNQFESTFEQDLAYLGDQSLGGLAVSGESEARPIRERIHADLASADKKLKTKPDDLDARFARAMANLRLGENQKALDDFVFVIGKNPENIAAKQYWVIALARLGKKSEADAELAKFQTGEAGEDVKMQLSAVVAAELGEGLDKELAALETTLEKRLEDADFRYSAASAFSLASKAISRLDKAKGRRLTERSLQLLNEAVKSGDANFGKMEEDGDLDPIRDDPGFAEIMRAGHRERRYTLMWTTDARFEAIPTFGLDPEAQVKRSRELIEQGFRPTSLSVMRPATGGSLVAASVWHRPTILEETKDDLVERQARAAIGLVRMGKSEEVWPLLRHSAEPRLRSFIVNWLSPLGADPEPIATKLAQLNSLHRLTAWGEGSLEPGYAVSGAGREPEGVGRGSPDPAHGADRRSPAGAPAADAGRPPVAKRAGSGDPRPTEGAAQAEQQTIDSILFHPETSIRRALILALGTYGTDRLSPGEREPLIAKLVEIYRDDPDAGIHGAAEWTLRKWGQKEKLKVADAYLIKAENQRERRWFVNSQGQTFAVIEGPVEFRMGSPVTELERVPGNDAPKRVVIPRSFAIATKEVTIDQFERFLKLKKITNERYQVEPSMLKKCSPDDEGPWIGPDWYTAAHYCNWLSEQDGLPKNQWCYELNASGEYAEGMSVPANVLERRGYRLPTKAEWECACRAGAITSRYYGNAVNLLENYAWYQANSKDHAWACGSLLPNDLGLFDMLGNDREWVQDRESHTLPRRNVLRYDHITSMDFVLDKHFRLLRGGAFGDSPGGVRSAGLLWGTASSRDPTVGLRPAMTYP